VTAVAAARRLNTTIGDLTFLDSFFTYTYSCGPRHAPRGRDTRGKAW
jgi:hypothetical protein